MLHVPYSSIDDYDYRSGQVFASKLSLCMRKMAAQNNADEADIAFVQTQNSQSLMSIAHTINYDSVSLQFYMNDVNYSSCRQMP